MNTQRRNDDQEDSTQRDEDLRRICRELAAIRQLFDHFAGTYLNAKFPYGRPTDRWGRR